MQLQRYCPSTGYRGFMVIALLFVCILSKGQVLSIQSNTLRWNSSGFNDQLTSEDVAAPCQFVTHAANQIDWIQGEGSFVITFDVTSTTGNWTNPEQNGTMVYTLTRSSDGLSGSITITKNNNGITLALLLNGGTQPVKNLYSITSYEQL